MSPPLKSAAPTESPVSTLAADAPDVHAAKSRAEAVGAGPIAGEIVHAMGTPVATLTTSMDLIAGGRMNPEEVAQIQKVMRNEMVKMKGMLQRCRELASVVPPVLARCDLAELLRAFLDATAPDLAAREVTATWTLPDEPAWVIADRAQVGGAIEAVVTNALEAIDGAGAIAFTLALEPGDGGDASKPHWALTIEDTGAGIAPTAVRNVFRLFFSTRKDHAGVGLSIVQQVIGAVHGSVEVRSAQGRGTRVTMRIPAATT